MRIWNGRFSTLWERSVGSYTHVLLCIAGLLFGLTVPARAQVVTNNANGHYYEGVFVSGGINWANARDAAAGRTHLGLKGHLATITSAAEEQFLIANLPNAVSGEYWLGGYQDHSAPNYSEPGGGWRWITGEAWSYTNWNSAEPDNNVTEDYLQFYKSDGGWNDGNGSFLLAGYVVEYENTAPRFDLNGDGKADLLFQHSTTGQIVSWYLDGTTVTGGNASFPTVGGDFKVRGTGDFNQDGKADLVFQSSSTGRIVIWFLNGTQYLGGAAASLVPLPEYKVVGVGDFDGDGLADIVLQSNTTGKVVVWFMNGTTVTSGSFISLTPSAGYQVVGVNDLNLDGHPDLVFQDQQSSKIAVWTMSGISVTNGFALPTPISGYHVVGVSGFDGFLPGLILQNSITNQLVLWYVSGGAVVGGGFVNAIPNSSYQVVGPR